MKDKEPIFSRKKRYFIKTVCNETQQIANRGKEISKEMLIKGLNAAPLFLEKHKNK